MDIRVQYTGEDPDLGQLARWILEQMSAEDEGPQGQERSA